MKTISGAAGAMVDPDSARVQTESGAIWGLTMALHEGTAFHDGQVRDTDLDRYAPLRIGGVPALEISSVVSTEVPVGVCEPATMVVESAIGNAICAAVGVRLRHLPITMTAIVAALAAK